MQNPHPLLVHFPIAFLTAFAVSALLLLVLPRPGLERFARASLFLGTAAAAVTVISGFFAEQTVAPVRAASEAIGEHRFLAYGTLLLAAALSALAVIAPRHPAQAGRFRVAQGVGALGLLVLLVLTGREGGELVHEYGVGTALTAPGGPAYDKDAPKSAAPRATDDAPAPTGKDFR